MKKFDFDKNYIQIAILAILVIIIGVIFLQTVENITSVTITIKKFIGFSIGLIKPFIVGFFFAYFLNPIVRTIENTSLINKIDFLSEKKRKRTLSIAITYVMALCFFYLLIVSILPSVIRNINALIVALPESLNNLGQMLDKHINNSGDKLTPIINMINKLTDQDYSVNHFAVNLVKGLSEAIFNLPKFVSSIFIGVVTLANGILAVILGFIISIYMINDKEYFLSQAKKIVYVLTKGKSTQKVFRVARLSNNTLEKFIVGKAIDSFIIGIIFFIICLAFKIPYASLFALIMGITNMIPYFGPFIGAVPILLITITWNYKMVIPVTIAIVLLQQFDGIILGPKILGDSIGIKPISIIFAILVGGGLFGVYGMFLGAPVYAVISTIISESIDKNYDKFMGE